MNKQSTQKDVYLELFYMS